MNTVDIDIQAARSVNQQLPNIVNHLGTIKNIVSRTQSGIDSRVLDSLDIRARLNNERSNIQSIESDLLLFHKNVAQNINNYEETDLRVVAKVDAIDQ